MALTEDSAQGHVYLYISAIRYLDYNTIHLSMLLSDLH
jgi:hypothetical protein